MTIIFRANPIEPPAPPTSRKIKLPAKTMSLKGREGPGSRLKNKWRSDGVQFACCGKQSECPECDKLALKMNQWGPDGCMARLDEIVEEILPRARQWVKENKPFVHKLLPGIVEDLGIRRKLRKDIIWSIEETRKEPKRLKTKAKNPKDTANKLPTRLTTPMVPEPFSDNITRNLIYHVYPLKNSTVWERNIALLLQYMHLFNGKRIVAVAEDGNTLPAKAVLDVLGDHVKEYIVVKNDPKTHEANTFLPLLEAVYSLNPNEVTFRAHAKGVTQHKRSHIAEWTAALYHTNLHNWPTVQEHLEKFPFTASFRRVHGLHTAPWFYAGAFYWFRHHWVFSREWRKVPQVRFAPEMWPGLLYALNVCGCLCVDNCPLPYSNQKWRRDIQPEYLRWSGENGVTL